MAEGKSERRKGLIGITPLNDSLSNSFVNVCSVNDLLSRVLVFDLMYGGYHRMVCVSGEGYALNMITGDCNLELQRASGYVQAKLTKSGATATIAYLFCVA